MKSRAVSFRAAWAGIVHVVGTQVNFRIQIAIGIAALGLAAWLHAALPPILLACALVLSLELLNTAVEATVDLISPARHESARIAKDCAAGAVLVAAIGAVAVGLVTLGPPLFDRILLGAK